jgi:phage terminase Nu1 subunit (DNA packaging protein)
MTGHYVTRRELATILGVSVRTVDRFRAEGMPAEDWGLRAVRFNPHVAVEWARGRSQRPPVDTLPR